MALNIIKWTALGVGLALAAALDVRSRRIPNALTVPLALLGFALGAANGAAGLRRSAIGFTVALLFGVLLWLLGVIKAGDAKLMAAIGAVQGTLWFVNCMTWALLTGLVLGLVILIRKGALGERMKRLGAYFKGILLSHRFRQYAAQEGTERELPFAIPILIGAILTVMIPIWRL